jgi:hypothetical protein
MECWLANIPQKVLEKKRLPDVLVFKAGIGKGQADHFMGHVPDIAVRVFVEPDHAQPDDIDI